MRPTRDLSKPVEKIHTVTKVSWLPAATDYYGGFRRGLTAIQRIPRRQTLIGEALLAALRENA